MSKIERLLIGAMGALSPVIATLITNDFVEVLQNAEPYETLGYCIRVVTLALVGMFVVYLYEDESNKMKVFQLGMAAPALFMATINGNHGPHRADPPEVEAVQEEEPMTIEGDTEAHLKSTVEVLEVRSLRMKSRVMMNAEPAPAAKPLQKFMHGLILQGD